MTIETMLKVIAFAMVCGIIGYILLVLIMWIIALGHIGAWVFTFAAGGGASG